MKFSLSFRFVCLDLNTLEDVVERLHSLDGSYVCFIKGILGMGSSSVYTIYFDNLYGFL